MIEKCAKYILNHYGILHQKSKTIEELAELIVALQKDILVGKESHSRAVLEEIADVHIMLTQLLDDEGDKTMVSLIVDKKLKRQIRRIKAEKDNNKTCKDCRWYTDESPLDDMSGVGKKVSDGGKLRYLRISDKQVEGMYE